jgi:hypothetical protein
MPIHLWLLPLSLPARTVGGSSLVPLAYKPLRLGTVGAQGWLLGQLKQQAKTLSGHLDLFWLDVNESIWIGGVHDRSGAGHERGPYWLNGIVPLSALLNKSGVSSIEPNIHSQMTKWITYILEHQNKTTGWLGPDDGFGGGGNTYWCGHSNRIRFPPPASHIPSRAVLIGRSAWNVVHSLLQFADAHADEPLAATCYAAVLAHVKEAYRRQQAAPLSSWSQNRWQDWVYLLHWLLDAAPQGHEEMLLAAASLSFEQRWHWEQYYRLNASQTPTGHTLPNISVPSWTMYDHGKHSGVRPQSHLRA